MIMKSAHVMFYSTLIMSTLIVLSSNSWFLAWFGLEMNLLSMIPLMIKKENIQSSEAAMKYFFVQSASSSLLVISSMQTLMLQSYSILISLALLLKLGAAPLHFWVPTMLEGINWLNTTLMLTWQKLAPLALLTLVMNENLMIFMLLSLFVGAIGGFNQVSTKKILAFSSISHLAWLMMATKLSMNILATYFIIYTLNTVALIYMFNNNNAMNINKMAQAHKFQKPYFYFFLLSLGGMPPLIGFFPKMIILSYMVTLTMYMAALSFIISSVINLYFYTRLVYSTITLHTISTMSFKKNVAISLSSLIMVGTLIPLLF